MLALTALLLRAAAADSACGEASYCVYNMAVPCPHRGACHGAPSRECSCDDPHADANACASCTPAPAPPTPPGTAAPTPAPVPPAVIAAEKAALQSVYDATSGASWRNAANWTEVRFCSLCIIRKL